MSKLSTGELAKICDVSVRTVQYYDKESILKPLAISEGGRRLYDDESVKTLKTICLLKNLGLSLKEIKEVIKKGSSNSIFYNLLDEKLLHLMKEIKEKEAQVKLIATLKDSITNKESLSIDKLKDIDKIMEGNKKLKLTHIIMLIAGVIMDLIQIATLLLWIFKGIWYPFVIGMVIVIILGIFMTLIYYRNTAYICPECHEKFAPSFKKVLFARHNLKARKLTCPKCGKTDYCIETYSD